MTSSHNTTFQRPPDVSAATAPIPTISVVVPVYNEEENIEKAYAGICEAFKTTQRSI